MSDKNIRLGINIDHVATLRQARGENYPCLGLAAEKVLEAGADQITIHLREDRRHIQDADVPVVAKIVKERGALLNLELSCAENVLPAAIESRPDWICLVPEKREEQTTEGGLNLLNADIFTKVKEHCELIKAKIPGVKISLFLEDSAVLELPAETLRELKVDAVEIHTGDYARYFAEKKDLGPYKGRWTEVGKKCVELGWSCHGGHGLTRENLAPLLQAKLFSEYNIGHWVVCESVFVGLEGVVRSLRRDLDR